MAWFQSGILLSFSIICFITSIDAQTLKITKIPDSPFYVEVGKVLTLDISYDYTGNEGIEAEWKKGSSDTVLIRRSADATILRSDNRTSIKDVTDLVLTNVAYNDNTTFHVLLSAKDTLEKPAASIQVIVAERPEIKFRCADVLNVNKSGTAECEGSTVKGSPTPWVQWYDKDGTAVGESGYGTKILSLKNIQPEKAGTYKCKATVGKFIDEKTLTIIVQYGPTKFTFSNVESVSLGTKDFTISCKTDGYPEPTYKLSRNSTEKVTQNGVYTIDEVKDDDAGKYTCEAKNNFGNISESFTLEVTSKIPTTTTMTTTVVTETTSTSGAEDGTSGGLGTGPIIGIVVGVLALIAFIVLLWYCCYRKPGDKDRVSNPDTDDERPSGSMPRNDENAYETPDKPPRASASRDSPPAQPANQPPLYSQVDKSRKTKKAPPTAQSPALTYAALDPVALQPDSSRMRERPNEDTQYADLQNLQGDLV